MSNPNQPTSISHINPPTRGRWKKKRNPVRPHNEVETGQDRLQTHPVPLPVKEPSRLLEHLLEGLLLGDALGERRGVCVDLSPSRAGQQAVRPLAVFWSHSWKEKGRGEKGKGEKEKKEQSLRAKRTMFFVLYGYI